MSLAGVIYIYIDSCRIHTDAINKQTQKDFFNKIFTLTLLQGFEKGYSRFACERELEIEHNCNILTPNLWPSMLCLSRSPDAQPEALGFTLLGASFLYCILSATSLVPKLHRGSRGPLGRMWLSLPQLVYLPLQLELELDWNRNSTVRRTQLNS